MLSPLVAVVLPSRPQYEPLWQPLFTTVSEAPLAVQLVKLPSSKPPLLMPPPLEPVIVSATVVVCDPLAAVPVTVSV